MKAELLDDRQCDAFAKEHGVSMFYTHSIRKWQCQSPELSSCACAGDSREEAITLYWRMHEPRWQPPEPVHDGNWALAYAEEHALSIQKNVHGDKSCHYHVYKLGHLENYMCGDESLVEAVEQWIDAYATPLPTMLELLEKLVEPSIRPLGSNTIVINRALYDEIKAVIEREKG